MNLCCPKCNSKISQKSLFCRRCKISYPNIDGTPVLIDNTSKYTLISKENIIKNYAKSRINRRKKSKIYKIFFNLIYGKSKKTFSNSKYILNFLGKNKRNILVIGSGTKGDNLNLIWNSNHNIIGIDIYKSNSVNIIADAHSLPFKEESFDCVIIQAVLEHVLNPFKVSSEIKRVLKKNGIFYAEFPFMQQVHEGIYDFFRSSHSGILVLFPYIKPFSSGELRSAALAFAWSYRELIGRIFSRRKSIVFLLSGPIFLFARILDTFLNPKNDLLCTGSSVVYLLGKKLKKDTNYSDIIKYLQSLK